jgi:ribosome-associated protein
MTVPQIVPINSRITIPRSELRFTFVRSSGPGGQNVNKVASKAVLRWSVRNSSAVSDEQRERIARRLLRRINDRGELILTSQRYRDQAKNIDDCLNKLQSLVASAVVPPRPRKKTRPSKAARETRLRDKRAAAEKKQRRRQPRDASD